MIMSHTILTIATRKSKLALWQANHVKSLLEKKYPNLPIQLLLMTTEGDQQQSAPLTHIGGKSVFVKTLQNALFNRTADIAVHSMKDMSVFPTTGLAIAAVLKRADARDAFVANHYTDLNALPENAIVGTASPRRTCLVKSLRPDCQIKLLHGNVDTRLSKLDEKQFDAIVLAAAGLERLGLHQRIRSYFPENSFTPAIAQGAIAIECRENDTKTRELLHFLNDTETAICTRAERSVNQVIGGDCHTAMGARATIIDGQLHLSAMMGSEDGKIILRSHAVGLTDDAEQLGKKVAMDLLSQGAGKLIM